MRGGTERPVLPRHDWRWPSHLQVHGEDQSAAVRSGRARAISLVMNLRSRITIKLEPERLFRSPPRRPSIDATDMVERQKTECPWHSAAAPLHGFRRRRAACPRSPNRARMARPAATQVARVTWSPVERFDTSTRMRCWNLIRLEVAPVRLESSPPGRSRFRRNRRTCAAPRRT